MNKDQIKGRAEQAKGKLKEVAGKVVGNERLQADGLGDQVKGRVLKNVGDAKHKLADRIDKL